MKLEHIVKLLNAAEAKKQLERTRLANLRAKKRSLVQEAEGFRETALRSRLADGDDLAGADFRNYGRYFDRLQDLARQKDNRAAELNAPIGEQEEIVRFALRQETAWQKLADAARTARRREFESREEQIREETSRRK